MIPAVFQRPEWEVADVIQRYGKAFLQEHGGHLTGVQKQALRDLGRCRTAELGGHVDECLDCGYCRIAYNSCRNRHCPKCQALTRARWLDKQAEHLLPVEYFHIVFTLPREVGDLALANPAVLYDLLFQAASATLRDVAANPKRLGAQVGALLVLHTWGQNLHHHPHVHAVVTGGGLTCNAKGVIDASPRWIGCRKGFFLPVKVLSRVFRGKYLAGLQQAFDEGKLVCPKNRNPLTDPDAFRRWLSPLYRKNWVVYAKRPFGGPNQVLKYLARYTHRVAISNARLLDVAGGQVSFRYKDYADSNQQKVMTLSADEFLRRFVQHVLPKSFVKIRHYGLLANKRREEKLAMCRLLLQTANVPGSFATSTPPEVLIDEAQAPHCPHCGSTRLVRRELLPTRMVCNALLRLVDST
jgi:Putative transposase/Transposase zinc-binding domain